MVNNIVPFLNYDDENLQFLYEECEKAYDNVFSAINEAQDLLREEQPDVYALLQRLNRNIGENSKSLFKYYYEQAAIFIKRASVIIPDDRQDLAWLISTITDLESKGNQDTTLQAMCFFHNAIKGIYQYFGLCVKSKNSETRRILVETACKHLGQSPDNVLTDAVKYALSIPVAVTHILSPIWQNLKHSRVIDPYDGHYPYIQYPNRMVMGVSFADLAYSSTAGVPDGKVIKEINPITVNIGKHCFSGVIDLPGSLRVVLCSDRYYSRSVMVCFRGTVNKRNWLTNITQFAICDDYVYHMALGIVLLVSEQYKNKQIEVYGHSLGGGLTQFSLYGADDPRILGRGYNSAGLSNLTLSRMKDPQNNIDMMHFHLRNDVVFNIGHHIGETIQSNCYFDTGISKEKILKVHSVEMLRTILRCQRYWQLT